MASKIKGFFKRFKHISQIFVYKEEHEMEIGCPTDVRHVSHIGSDGTSMNAPSWMNDFRTASDFSSRSISNLGQSRDRNNWEVASWSSQDFQQSLGIFPASAIFADSPNAELPKVPKKTMQKKSKVSSPLLSSSSMRYSMRASKLKRLLTADKEGAETHQLGLV